ncbi:MAG: hypothetical protein CL834_02090 [Crocinitomicaceae bacterium]|nr:hypothetical protein [Crocinitomicaceae bacterium]|tara:strand:+ start:795 stop:1271 length:477 start_codon:yes stop_codon:yes gene_type:complete
MSPNKAAYKTLISQCLALLEGEPSLVANLANLSAALKHSNGWHWVGFYLVDDARDELVLGPFQGPVACTRLHKGKGVCAAAWETATAQIVPNVHEFLGHVACSNDTNSELVIPVQSRGRVVAVLDIDSVEFDAFSSSDVEALKPLIEAIEGSWNQWEA